MKFGGDVRPALMKFWPGIAVVAAIALYCALSINLTGTVVPWTKREPDRVTSGMQKEEAARPAVPPALPAVRKRLSELAARTNVAPAYAEDLAGATAFYNAHNGPLLWVADSGFVERGNAVISELRQADDWGLRASDFAVPQLPSGSTS